MKDIKKTIFESKAYSCLDCGKCTSACPVARHDSGFSPRMLVYDAIHESGPEVFRDGRLWQCLTCASCETICASDVRYGEFIRALRGGAYEQGISGQCTHGGALQALMHIMASDELNQNRLDWLTRQLETADTSDTLYFVGCAPYFETFFADLNTKSLKGATGSITLLNRMGIVPAISPNERCCGHDLLNSGDVEGFLKLARQNVKEIAESGASRVVVSCPEGYHTLKEEYPRYLGNTGFEVVHIMDLVAQAVLDGSLQFHAVKKKVTYHDPCRLGRISGIYDQPRDILGAIPGLQIVEMGHHRSSALCCGTQSWMNCGSVNKQIQVELLREAKATGADILLTACPKCKIHLQCAMHDEVLGQDLKIEIKSFASFVAGALAR
ncbi:MAG: (Fe-S)-binding protein [Chloroflexi bacterium]|nr:(Fe-S)-binding protein [Chloroflexota bacterium]